MDCYRNERQYGSFFFFSSRRRHTRWTGDLEFRRVLFRSVEGLAAALYHFNPALRSASLLRPGDSSRQIATALAQPALAIDTAALVFITAIFERAVFKYGNRGYRFTLLEAGHVAQNLNVAATALGLGCVNIGAFTDQEIDDFLGLDGMTHATLYLVSIGQAASEAEEAAEPSQSPGES